MPETARNRVCYSELQGVFRVGILLRVCMLENSVAAAQWEVRGHMEDPAFQRKPSRPIRALRESRQRCNTSSVARPRAPRKPEALRAAESG
jgi:hypothetical protein